MDRRGARGWLIALGVSALVGGFASELAVAVAGVGTEMTVRDLGITLLREHGQNSDPVWPWLVVLAPRLWPGFVSPRRMSSALYLIGIVDLVLAWYVGRRRGKGGSPRATRWWLVTLGLAAVVIGVMIGGVVEKARVVTREIVQAAAVDLVPASVAIEERPVKAAAWMDMVSPHLRRVFVPAGAIPWVFFVIGAAHVVLAWRVGRASVVEAASDGEKVAQ